MPRSDDAAPEHRGGRGPDVPQVAEGQTGILPDKVHDILDKRTGRTWPTTWFVPRLTGEGAFSDVYSVMANWGANHGVVYGHVGGRPDHPGQHAAHSGVHAQRAGGRPSTRPPRLPFGTQCNEAADYAACKNYGPLYG